MTIPYLKSESLPQLTVGSFILLWLEKITFLNYDRKRYNISKYNRKEKDMNSSEKLVEYVIPDNILESKRIFGFRRRNWIEGIICAGIIGFIIVQIPFVLRVKIIFLVCMCGPVLLLNLVGIRDQSIFEAMSNIRLAKSNKGEYHLRRPNEKEHYKQRGMEQSVNGIGNGDSAADKVADYAKRKYAQFKDGMGR